MGLRLRRFFIQLRHWEYWPFGLVQFPLFVMWGWYALRQRSLFYFSASNPGILNGGMWGESKFDVLSQVPPTVKPVTIRISLPATTADVLRQMANAGLRFPVIAKPDLGERGWMVQRLDDDAAVTAYLSVIKIDFLIQEWIDLPLEFGVYYMRFPSEQKGHVNSITAKEFLSVVGDGKSTLGTLIRQHDRAFLQWQALQEKYKTRWEEILARGQREELVSIGNHCLGTKFINANHLITAKLSDSFDRISQQIDGFYFGRYDLRCGSLEDLENGNVKIVELNGCGAEPSHIYHPGASFWKGMSELIVHWQNIYRISRENHARGVSYLAFHDGVRIYKKFRALKD